MYIIVLWPFLLLFVALLAILLLCKSECVCVCALYLSFSCHLMPRFVCIDRSLASPSPLWPSIVALLLLLALHSLKAGRWQQLLNYCWLLVGSCCFTIVTAAFRAARVVATAFSSKQKAVARPTDICFPLLHKIHNCTCCYCCMDIQKCCLAFLEN